VRELDQTDLGDLQTLISALIEFADDFDNLDSTVTTRDAEVALQRIEIAAELKALTDQALRDAVEQARSHDVSWQMIGDVLGITRQAAFQRFRNPDDPRGFNAMKTQNNTTLVPGAEAVYHHLAAGDYQSVARQMTFLAQRVLNEKKVMGVWSDVIAMAGNLESLGESFVRPSGSNVVVETPLLFEAGDFVGRIAYNRRNKITGMLILRPEDVPSAPF
jgi:hypothetical protein